MFYFFYDNKCAENIVLKYFYNYRYPKNFNSINNKEKTFPIREGFFLCIIKMVCFYAALDISRLPLTDSKSIFVNPSP